MFQVKICGITSERDALSAIAAGADAIGLNFYRRGTRYVEPRLAAQIASAIGNRVVKVGVFVNSEPDEIRAIAHACQLDLVQLHGDEPPASLLDLEGLRVMCAFRVANDLASMEHYLRTCAGLSVLPRLILADAAVPGHYGGSGTTADWDLLAGGDSAFCGLPLVLAGGLNAANVAAAIAAVHPVAVDVASGVEESPGRKSAARMREFVHAAKAALAGLGGPGKP